MSIYFYRYFSSKSTHHFGRQSRPWKRLNWSSLPVAGTNWDLFNITGEHSLDGLDAAAPFSIKVILQGWDTHPDEAANFDLAQSYSWILPPPDNGGFTVSHTGNDVLLYVAAAPEP